MTDLNDLKRRMEGAVNAFYGELQGLRTGRASAGLVENVTVEAYGTPMPLNQVASISVPEARLIVVQVWDQSNVTSVEKGIRNAGLGLNPATEGQTVRVPLPELTEERRQELAKVASKYAEQARIAIRNIRRDGMDDLKKAEKAGDISEDEMHGEGEKIQKLTDQHIEKIDQSLKEKEEEISTV